MDDGDRYDGKFVRMITNTTATVEFDDPNFGIEHHVSFWCIFIPNTDINFRMVPLNNMNTSSSYNQQLHTTPYVKLTNVPIQKSNSSRPHLQLNQVQHPDSEHGRLINQNIGNQIRYPVNDFSESPTTIIIHCVST